MTVFADSSALVKLYVAEAGHAAIGRISGPIVVSSLARVEVPAALWAKSRIGDLDAVDAALLTAAFEADFHGDAHAPPRFIPVAASLDVLIAAARAAAAHGLRGYDSVQLASATAARAADPSIGSVAVFDVRLRAAFLAEGFVPVAGT